MNNLLLATQVQDFIRSYDQEVSKLAFAGSPFSGITVQELIQQIEGRRKAEKKLPLWYNTPGIYFPPKLNIEQTSSEVTAAYKASLLQGESCIDVTGGFGIDAYYFSKQIKEVTHCELHTGLSEIARHNAEVLKTENIKFQCDDGVKTALSNHHDVIYVDPSRRHQTKGKVFFLKDCEPNVPLHLSNLIDACNTLVVKTSPMLDLSVGLNELQYVDAIHIVAVNNEVKELLWIVKKDASTTNIITINLHHDTKQCFSFELGSTAEVTHAAPQKYLYEPNAAIMKSGAFNLIPEAFAVQKIATHTHLYTSKELIDFPGRSFTIEQIIPYTKKEMSLALKGIKANVTTRNFPEPVTTIRKKWKLKEGGHTYLFFTTVENGERVVLKCSKTIV